MSKHTWEEAIQAHENQIIQAAVFLFEEAARRGLAVVTNRGNIVFSPDAVDLYGRYYKLSEWLREHSPEHYRKLRDSIDQHFGKGKTA